MKKTLTLLSLSLVLMICSAGVSAADEQGEGKKPLDHAAESAL